MGHVSREQKHKLAAQLVPLWGSRSFLHWESIENEGSGDDCFWEWRHSCKDPALGASTLGPNISKTKTEQKSSSFRMSLGSLISGQPWFPVDSDWYLEIRKIGRKNIPIGTTNQWISKSVLNSNLRYLTKYKTFTTKSCNYHILSLLGWGWFSPFKSIQAKGESPGARRAPVPTTKQKIALNMVTRRSDQTAWDKEQSWIKWCFDKDPLWV